MQNHFDQAYIAYFSGLEQASRTSSSNSTPEKPRLSFGIEAILSPDFGMKKRFSSISSSRSNSPDILEPMSLAAQLIAATMPVNQPVKSTKSSSNSRARTIFTEEQLDELESAFERNQYVIGDERVYLAERLGLEVKQVKIWFQNRRIKHRRRKRQSLDSN